MTTMSFQPDFSDDDEDTHKSVNGGVSDFKWEGDELDYCMPFGKYKGTSLRNMVSDKRKRQYIRWTLANFNKMFDETRRLFTVALKRYEDAKQSAKSLDK